MKRLAVVLASCGRIGFDPLGGGPTGDGGGSGGSLAPGGEACANAVTLTPPLSGTATFTGTSDDIAGTSLCPDVGVDIVYAISSTAVRTLHFAPTFSGQLILSATCPPVAFTSVCFPASPTMPADGNFSGSGYFIVKKMPGGGTTFELDVH